MPKKPPPQPKLPGPKAETLKQSGNWQDAMKTAMAKKKPKDGWPKK